jgi:hypothetical protein
MTRASDALPPPLAVALARIIMTDWPSHQAAAKSGNVIQGPARGRDIE